MKKLIPVAIVAVIAGIMFFGSCKKKSSDPTGIYTCVCSFTFAGIATTDTVFTSPSEAKSTATSQCNTEATLLTSTGATGVSCVIK